MTFTRALPTNNFGCAKYIVDGSVTANGTHSTIQAAIDAASSGDTIFIRPKTSGAAYSENLTLKAGVNLTAFGSDSSLDGTGKVIISGTCTMTTAGSVTISGIQLQTNSAALLSVTGSAASIVNLFDCYLNCTNNSGITFSSSSASAKININRCTGDTGTTGINLFAMSSAGTLNILYTTISNSGATVTANTASGGQTLILWSDLTNPITTSGSTALVGMRFCTIVTSSDTTAFTEGTTASPGSTIHWSTLSTGSASAISVSASSTLNLNRAIIVSTNTNAITGAGTLKYSNLDFTSTSSTINTTTQSGGLLPGGRFQAPSAGFIGEQIRSALASGSAISLVNNTAANVTSISLTAGVWDVTGSVQFQFSTVYVGTHGASIGTTSATTGTFGDNYFLAVAVATATTIYDNVCVPPYRITLTSTTTVYLVAIAAINAGTITAFGRISATRVG